MGCRGACTWVQYGGKPLQWQVSAPDPCFPAIVKCIIKNTPLRDHRRAGGPGTLPGEGAPHHLPTALPLPTSAMNVLSSLCHCMMYAPMLMWGHELKPCWSSPAMSRGEVRRGRGSVAAAVMGLQAPGAQIAFQLDRRHHGVLTDRGGAQ